MNLWYKKVTLTLYYMHFFAIVNIIKVLAILLSAVGTTLHHSFVT